ncbi:hypothetical protein Btru_010442 [Bulinus truncatus]|nr:hypothetical protein Btru_010442 [Bulinus truncatus]
MLSKKTEFFKRKKKLSKRSPVSESLVEVLNSTSWSYYSGTLDGASVVVTSSGDMDFLFRMGFFGKGSLSRSDPSFSEQKQKVFISQPSSSKAENDVKSQKFIMSKRNYLLHSHYKELLNKKSHDPDHCRTNQNDSNERSPHKRGKTKLISQVKKLKYQPNVPSVSTELFPHLTSVLELVSRTTNEQIATYVCVSSSMLELSTDVLSVNPLNHSLIGKDSSRGKTILLSEMDSVLILDSDEEQTREIVSGNKSAVADWDLYDKGTDPFWTCGSESQTTLTLTNTKVTVSAQHMIHDEIQSSCKSMENKNEIFQQSDCATSPKDQVTRSTSPKDQVTRPTSPKDQVTRPTSPKDQVTRPTSPKDQVTRPTSPKDQVTRLTSPKDQVTRPTSPEDQVTRPTSPKDQVTRPTSPKDQVTRPTSPKDDQGTRPPPKEDQVSRPTSLEDQLTQLTPLPKNVSKQVLSNKDEDNKTSLPVSIKVLRLLTDLPKSPQGSFVVKPSTFLYKVGSKTHFTSALLRFYSLDPVLHFDYTCDPDHLPVSFFITENKVSYLRIFPPVADSLAVHKVKILNQRYTSLPGLKVIVHSLDNMAHPVVQTSLQHNSCASEFELNTSTDKVSVQNTQADVSVQNTLGDVSVQNTPALVSNDTIDVMVNNKKRHLIESVTQTSKKLKLSSHIDTDCSSLSPHLTALSPSETRPYQKTETIEPSLVEDIQTTQQTKMSQDMVKDIQTTQQTKMSQDMAKDIQTTQQTKMSKDMAKDIQTTQQTKMSQDMAKDISCCSASTEYCDKIPATDMCEQICIDSSSCTSSDDEQDDETPDCLVIANTSDDEEHLHWWRPCLKKDPWPVKENLLLTLEEAFFLSFGLGCLCVTDNDQKKLSLTQMWHKFQELKDQFIPHYVVYHYFRSKGWVPKSGLKFGCDFILYRDGPPFYHGSYSVLVTTVKDRNILPHLKNDGFYLDQHLRNWTDLSGVNRVVDQVAKTLMLCYVIWPEDELKNEDLLSPKCLVKFKVKEVIVSRWVPSQERECLAGEDIP